MNSANSTEIAIVGGGVVGLAHAYMAARNGHRVTLFERDEFAVGASVRNFGLLWPIGQKPGDGLDWALRGRAHWIEVAAAAGIWLNQNGSLHVATHADELDVLNEFVTGHSEYPGIELIDAKAAATRSSFLKEDRILGALWSPLECTVNPREAIRQMPGWLHSKYGVELRYGTAVQHIESMKVHTSAGAWNADQVFICSGPDTQLLFPELFVKYHVKKCKLQMMKASSNEKSAVPGPSLCAGLTLLHYAAFEDCPSLARVSDRYDRENASFKEHGVHVLVSVNNHGEIIIGDSHHYGLTVEPFDSEEVNSLILGYLHSFADMGTVKIIERWHGIYPKSNDVLAFVETPLPAVHVVNGLGGAGMTLSFGLAEDVIKKFL